MRIRRKREDDLARRVRAAEDEAARVIARAEAIDRHVDDVEEKLELIYDEMREEARRHRA